MAPRRWRLVAIDLDGTLLPGTTANRVLDERLGIFGDLDQLEHAYAHGQVSNAQVADELAQRLQGRRRREIVLALKEPHLLRDAGYVVRALKVRGVAVVLATVTWQFAAAAVARTAGIPFHTGVRLETLRGRFTGRVVEPFDELDKLAFVDRVRRSLGATLDECVAIGDGRSDIPLFEQVGFSVALNPSPDAAAAADAVTIGETLYAAVRLVPCLLDEVPIPTTESELA